MTRRVGVERIEKVVEKATHSDSGMKNGVPLEHADIVDLLHRELAKERGRVRRIR